MPAHGHANCPLTGSLHGRRWAMYMAAVGQLPMSVHNPEQLPGADYELVSARQGVDDG